jgi:4-amino-4-deoxy-L-arabinose transferase-like glycosyltransferase
VSNTISRGREAALVIGLLALSVALRCWFLSVPLERDEGEYAYIAWLIDHGGAPYKDAFDQKPPGSFFAYFAIMKLFGFTIEGIHLGAALWCAGTASFIYLIGKRLHSPPAGLLGAAIFSVAALSPAVIGTAANTEMFMAFPTAAAAYVASGFVVSGGSVRGAFLCGLLVGWAAMFKQVALADGAFFLAVVAMTAARGPSRVRETLSRAALFSAGFLAALVPVLAYLVWRSALSEFVKDTMTVNTGYVGIVPLSAYPARLLTTLRGSFVLYLWPHVLAGLLGVGLLLARKVETRGTRWFLPAWLTVSFLGVAPGGMFREHYFFQVLAPLALLGGLALVAATRAIAWAPLRYGVCAVIVTLPLAVGFRPLFALTPDQVSEALYPGSPFVAAKAVARVVAENSAPDDRVLIFGSEPQILFYAGRKSASRYILTYPLMMQVPGAPERQIEMFQDLQSVNPRVIVVVSDPMSHLAGPWSSQYIFDNLKTVLARDYRLIYPDYPAGGPKGKIGVYLRRP